MWQHAVLVAAGHVHVGSGKGLYTLDAVTGTPKWRFQAGGDIVGAQDGNLVNARLPDGRFALVGILYGDCAFTACANTSFGACGFGAGCVLQL